MLLSHCILNLSSVSNVENTGGKHKVLAIKVIQIEVLRRSQRCETTLSDSDDCDGARPWGSGAQELPVCLGSVAGVSQWHWKAGKPLPFTASKGEAQGDPASWA